MALVCALPKRHAPSCEQRSPIRACLAAMRMWTACFCGPRYGYFGRECTDRLVPLGVILLAIAAVQSSPFAVGLNLPHR